MRYLRSSGLASAVLAASSFGTATVLARELARAGVDDASVLAARFGTAAATLMLLDLVRGRSLRPARGETAAAALLGVVVYGSVAGLFFAALQRGSAGGVTVVFYAYPLIVAGIETARRRCLPGWRVSAGIVAAGTGTYAVVSAGGVAISAVGVALALGAATAFAGYLVIATRVLVETTPSVRATWTAAGTACFGLGQGVIGHDLALPAREVPVALASGLATAAGFFLLFEALPRLGATRTAVVLNFEAVAAIAVGAVALGEGVTILEVAGAAVVLAAATWTSRVDSRLISATAPSS